MRTSSRSALAVCLSVLASTAAAQTKAQAAGQGSLSHGGRAEILSGASLEMGLTGEVNVQLQAGATAYAFHGRWTGSGADAVRLTLSDGLGDTHASGTGSATIRGSQLVHLELNGTSRLGRFVAVFDAAKEPETPLVPNPSGFSLDQNATGSGTLTGERGRGEDLKKVHVIFEKNGDGQVTLWGGRTSTLKGRWKNLGRDSYELEVTSGFDSPQTRATLRVYLARGHVNIVEGTGNSPGTGGDFTLRFDAGK